MGHYQFFQLLQTIKNNHEGKTQLFSFIVLTITKTICLKDFFNFTEKPFSIKLRISFTLFSCYALLY